MNTSTFLTLLAQDATPQAAPSLFGSPIFMLIIMIAFMYLLIIRPQQKQKKEQQARMDALKKGDQVITAGGIHGLVHHVSDTTVTLKLSEGNEGNYVRFDKTSITTVNKASAPKDADAKDSLENSSTDEK